jgi:anti-sigma factor RsiW
MSSECDQFEKAVSTYQDGELPRVEIRTLFLHLADCEKCRAFWDTIRNVERRALKEERIVASGSLDERVVSIRRMHKAMVDGKAEPPLPVRSVRREQIHAAAYPADRRQVFNASFAVSSLFAAVLGLILGVVQPWSYVVAPNSEPQIVYVSMLPNMTVLGHLNELNIEGKSK